MLTLAACGKVTITPHPMVVAPRPVVPQKREQTVAELYWIAPTQNTDGSALTDLSGYLISYWEARLQVVATIHVGVGQQVYDFDSLPPGLWCFAIQAQNSSGVLSAMSNTVSKEIGNG